MKPRTGLGPAYRVENSTGLHILGPQVCIFLWFYSLFTFLADLHAPLRFTRLWRGKSWLWSAGKTTISQLVQVIITEGQHGNLLKI